MNSLIGEQIAGEYEIVDALGNGATSVVYKAVRIADGKIFAIKILHAYLVEKEDTRKRFEQEAKACMLLAHPNIIKVHALNKTADGQPYLLMDYVDGKTLSELISQGPLQLPRAWKLFIQIADAMQHAHSQGIVHRSLKPSNIIVKAESQENETVLVSDFGLAKLLPSSGEEIQALTAKGAIIGSPLYMSPEQCLGREIDGRADIYSFGCLMYATLTGKAPLKGENILDTMSKHVSDFPETFDIACPDLKLPPQAQAIAFKCMAKRPEDRYETMELLKQDLLRLQQGKRPKAMSSATAKSPEQSKKQAEPETIDVDRYLKLTLAAILVLLLGLVAYAIWKSPQYKNPDEIKLGKQFESDLPSTRPLAPLTLLKQADELRLTGRMEEARALYRQSIWRAEEQQKERLTVDHEVLATAHYGLAGLYYQLGDYEEAEKELRLALYVQELAGPNTAPGKERLQVELAECQMRAGKFSEAKDLLMELKKENNDTLLKARVYVMLADLATAAEKKQEAEENQKEALALLKGKSGLARRYYCLILSRYANQLICQKSFDKCISILESALNERPRASRNEYDNDASIYLSGEIARAKTAKGDIAGALAICQSTKSEFLEQSARSLSLRIYSRDKDILEDIIAALESLQGKNAKAIQDLEESASIRDGRFGSVGTLVRILLSQNHSDEASKVLEAVKSKALKHTVSRSEFHALKALCYLKKSQADTALEEIDQALKDLSNTREEGLHNYCLRIKCAILRRLNRQDAAELIEKSIGKPNPYTESFDNLVPEYQRSGSGW